MLERRLVIMDGKMKLYGFNNLTKSLSFNIYDVCYAKTQREQKDYISYIDEQYNSCLLYTSIRIHAVRSVKPQAVDAEILNPRAYRSQQVIHHLRVLQVQLH